MVINSHQLTQDLDTSQQRYMLTHRHVTKIKTVERPIKRPENGFISRPPSQQEARDFLVGPRGN